MVAKVWGRTVASKVAGQRGDRGVSAQVVCELVFSKLGQSTLDRVGCLDSSLVQTFSNYVTHSDSLNCLEPDSALSNETTDPEFATRIKGECV